MKVLVTTTPGLGHALPVLPVAVELRGRGHEVRWIAGPGSSDAVADAGIDVLVAGMPEGERQAELARRHPELSSIPPHERQRVAFPRVFAELAAPHLIDPVRDMVEAWAPEVIVHEAAELAAPLVAAYAGIPSVSHGFGQIVPAAATLGAGEVMAPWWLDAGLEPDAHAGVYRGLYVDIYPPSLRSADMEHVPRVQLRRPADAEPAVGNLVYVTFGTLFNRTDGIRSAVLGAARVAEEVLVTVGRGVEPERLGPLPANVTVAPFVDQALVLPRCTGVVCHGGSGTVLAALAHGVPVVCIPQGADQFANAANVVRAGAGESLTGPDVTEADVRAAIERVRSPGPRAAARRLAEEIARMPSAADAADAIEAHARRA